MPLVLPHTVAQDGSPHEGVEFSRRPVPPRLEGLVAGRCGIRERARTEVHRRLPASTLIPVVISFGDPLDVIETVGGEGGTCRYGSFVVGFRAGHTLTRFRGEQAGIQVYLTPLGVQQILGVPGREVANQVVDLDVVAPSLAALAGPIAEACTWEERLDLVDRELVALAQRRFKSDEVVCRMWETLEQSAGSARISQLTKETNLSQRLVTERFVAQVGLSPKVAARVLRFEHAASLLAANTRVAEVAAIAGYSDQSHLTREFSTLAGRTPAAWAAARSPSPRGALGMA